MMVFDTLRTLVDECYTRFSVKLIQCLNIYSISYALISQYLRCEIDVEVEKLGDMLLKRWAIPKPNLLISVFGGHSKFDSKKLSKYR